MTGRFTSRVASTGQVLVLFVLFLLVLLGVSAIGIDYAAWLLTDRSLQNTADHAALAGAGEFDQRISQGACSGGPGQAKCINARAQAWTSLSQELDLNLTAAAVAALSTGDSPAAGQPDGTYGGQTVTFKDTIWVATPPPSYAAYQGVGGRYALNYGVVFVRVDRDVPSFLGGALGIRPQPRHGWATAGALPTDFALEVFCRNHIAPQSGVCVNSAGLALDGNGVMVRLRRGDIGSNESLTVTSNNGSGVVVESGNMFLVNRNCAPSTWNCPQTPAVLGGIADADLTVGPGNNKNAFYIAPLPVPQFQSPLGNAADPLNDQTTKTVDCVGASTDHLCVPYRPFVAGLGSPGDWSCSSSAAIDPCGLPVFDTANGEIDCQARTSGTPDNHLDPTTGGADFGNVAGTPNQSNGNEYQNIDDNYAGPAPDTTATPAKPPTDFVYIDDLNHPNNPPVTTMTTAYTINLKQPFGVPNPGTSTVRYVAFKTDAGAVLASDPTGYPVELTVALLQGGTSIATDVRTLTVDPTRYEFTVGAGLITDYNNLALRYTFRSANQSNNSALERGGGISWAEVETPSLIPGSATPPMIPPGYYHSISIDANGCAILDPTAVYSDLYPFQMPGIYRFEGDNSAEIDIGADGALIGDGVTLVFDSGFGSTGAGGLQIGNDAVLAINSSRVPGTPTCTPSENETLTYNPSAPLVPLAESSLCAAWAVDVSDSAPFKPGLAAWPYCDPANVSNPQCVDRTAYTPTAGYRGVSFYFTPADWTPENGADIEDRFSMGGGAGATPGIAFRGVLYAPYDNVKMSGGCNGFNTVGQVLSWTAKFNGGCGYIELDYPYDYTPASPYLLEPTVDH